MTTTLPNVRRARATILVLAGVGYLALAVATYFGLSFALLTVCAAAPWALTLRRRLGAPVAVSLVTVLGMWLVVVAFSVTGVTSIPLLPLLVGGLSVGGLLGVARVLAARERAGLAEPRPRLVVPGWLLGPFLWLGVLAGTLLLKGQPVVAWVLPGDAANNFLFARDVIAREGIDFGGEANPAPMTSIALAFFALPGRWRVAQDDLVEHDLVAFATVWAMSITMLCLLAGLLARVLQPAGGSRALAIGIPAVASLLPLTWFVSGYALDYGFANAPLVLVALVASCCVAFGLKDQPHLALVIQPIAATVVLATWAPLVLVPGALWLVALVRVLTTTAAPLRGGLWLHLASLLQLVLFAAVLTLPALRVQGDALSGGGAAHVFEWETAAVLALATAVGAVLLFPKRFAHEQLTTLAVIVGANAGVGALLALNVGADVIWTYYPLKLLWVAMVLAILLGTALAGAALARATTSTPRPWASVIALATGALVVIVPLQAPAAGPADATPLTKIPADRFFAQEGGNDLALTLAELSSPARAVVVWQSESAQQEQLNFWLLKLSIGTFENRTDADEFVQLASYGIYDLNDIGVLCQVLASMRGEAVSIVTANTAAEQEIRSTCPVDDRDIQVLDARALLGP